MGRWVAFLLVFSTSALMYRGVQCATGCSARQCVSRGQEPLRDNRTDCHHNTPAPHSKQSPTGGSSCASGVWMGGNWLQASIIPKTVPAPYSVAAPLHPLEGAPSGSASFPAERTLSAGPPYLPRITVLRI